MQSFLIVVFLKPHRDPVLKVLGSEQLANELLDHCGADRRFFLVLLLCLLETGDQLIGYVGKHFLCPRNDQHVVDQFIGIYRNL